MQELGSIETGLDFGSVDNIIRTVQRMVAKLGSEIGEDRKAHVMQRLSNAGSGNAGAVVSNRIDAYLKKVCHLHLRSGGTPVQYVMKSQNTTGCITEAGNQCW